jgi:hypothetical protein
MALRSSSPHLKNPSPLKFSLTNSLFYDILLLMNEMEPKMRNEASETKEEEMVTCMVCGDDIKESEAYERYPNVPLCSETCHMMWILEF